MVAVSAGPVVPGVILTHPQWLAERIADMGISWGTGNARASGTLWWCMAASSLIDPVVTAYVQGRSAPDPSLEHVLCEIRPDGVVERVFPAVGRDDVEASGSTVLPGAAADRPGTALRVTLERIIPLVAEASGASEPSLWAVVADAIGNRAIDAGDAAAGARLAGEVAGRLPVPRFTDIGGRTYVRRISCCLVFEAPGCQMCTSCPKRPAPERHELLTRLATGS